MTEVFKSATSRTAYFELVNSSTGLPEPAIVYSAVTGSYVRSRSARTAITMATLGSASAAWSSGGFILVDDTNQPGIYRFDIPDAAFASGVDEVVVTLKATGCRTVSRCFVLVDWNKQVAAIPNAAAAASGGLPTVDASNAVKVQSGTGANQISLTSGLVTLAGVTHTGAVIPTVSTLTGHTAQTGDSFARIGALGAGLTSLAPSATALSTAVWTGTKAGYIDVAISSRPTATALNTAFWESQTNGTDFDESGSIGKLIVDNLNASITSRMATFTLPTNFSALGINASGHVSRVTLVDTTTTNTDMRGTDSAALAATALSSAIWTNTKAGYLDAAISSVAGGGGEFPETAPAGWITAESFAAGAVQSTADFVAAFTPLFWAEEDSVAAIGSIDPSAIPQETMNLLTTNDLLGGSANDLIATAVGEREVVLRSHDALTAPNADDCAAAAFAMGSGPGGIVGSTLLRKIGSYVLRTFALNSASNPTSRT